jgi:hypothetical protein
MSNAPPSGGRSTELLKQVAAENVTWVGYRRSFRLWQDEHSYTLVTRRMKRLLAAGLVRCDMAAGYTYVHKGPVVLTDAGWEALND